MLGKVDTTSLYERFSIHFNETGNEKILFSAKYGSGKTTFLKDFFLQNKEYYPVFVSPVNYVVNPSVDVFDLIKVDVIRQLYEDDTLQIEAPKDIKLSELLLATARKEPVKLLSRVASLIAALNPDPFFAAGKSIVEGVEKTLDLFKAIEKQIDEKRRNPTQKFIEDFYENEKSFLEYNIISQTLAAIISELKLQYKYCVLVIDDVDRMDPEHVFRVLNVFSAHYDDRTDGHKLGFNKVIVVADYDNLKYMFSHRYGEHVDFNGYIEKFYSSEIYRFDIKTAVSQALIKMNLPLNDYSRDLLLVTLTYFVEVGVVKIRNLSKLKNFSWKEISDNVVYQRNGKKLFHSEQLRNLLCLEDSDSDITLRLKSFEELLVYRVLIQVFGDRSTFREALKVKVHEEVQKRLSHLFQGAFGGLALLDYFFHREKSELEHELFFKSIDTLGGGRWVRPFYEFYSWKYYFEPVWNKSKLYQSIGCYYEGIVIKSELHKKGGGGIKEIFNTMDFHMMRIEDRGWLNNIAVSS